MLERIDNWVVLMFENRSFDNLLGHLPHIASEDGVRDRDIELPYPGGTVKIAPSDSFVAPLPDPGEGYGNVSAQLWNAYLPKSNRGKSPYPLFPNPMAAPQNVPDPRPEPTMDGFALDYYWNFLWEKERLPTDEEMQQIGLVFTPETAPVLNQLAQEFAVFTHWHCEVPTCTFPNRSFFHCGTSMGKVDNDNVVSYGWDHKARNLFDLFTDKGLEWKAYFDKSQVIPNASINLGGLHHIRMWKTHAVDREQFFVDAAAGTLPTYSWIEPNMLFGEMEDYHPPHDIRAGEQLLARVYNAIRQSPQWETTALIVTFDEHGGTYDHVPPPDAPVPDDYPGQLGFGFDRFGIRIPTVVISPYTARETVITDLFHTTSALHTLRDRFDLGPPLSKRDEAAPPLTPAFNLDSPRSDAPWSIEGLPYEWRAESKEEKAAAFGDAPDVGLLKHKKKEARSEEISQLGEATLRNVARIVGADPANVPTNASDAREWLVGLIKSGKLPHLPLHLPHRH